MAMTKNKKYAVEMYIRYFGKTPTNAQIAEYAEFGKAKLILNEIRTDAGLKNANMSKDEQINDLFINLFGRAAIDSELTKYKVKYLDKGKDLPINSIIKAAKKGSSDKAVWNTKKLVALLIAEEGSTTDFDLDKITKDTYAEIFDGKKLTITTVAQLEAKGEIMPDIFNGQTFMLNAGVDTGKDFVGTAKNDEFYAIDDANRNETWTIGDSIDGGAGIDTFNVITDNDVTTPFQASVTNVENMNVTANGTVTLDTTGFTGLTTLHTTSKSTVVGVNADVTAAATTDVNVNATSAAAPTVVEKIAVNGGKNVTVVSKNNDADTITVGATTAAAGNVTVTSTGSAGTATLGAITVNGGTTVTIDQNAGNVVSTTNTGGKVIVNGNASTTTVTVNQTATAGATATVVGYTAGAVDIHDVNKGDSTKAGIIETVNVKNAGAVDVDSGALKTLNLEGIITSVDATSTGSKATVDTLALNLNGVNTGAVGIDTDVKTLNIKSSTTASTIGTTTTDATAINISGDAKLTLSTLTLNAAAGNEVITVTNTAGVTIGNALATDVTFTGGAGNDTIILAGAQTKAITMGAGNDKVTYAGALGTGGSVAAGDGEDTIVMKVAEAENVNGASKDSVFNSSFSGFEVLELSAITGGAATINLTGINAVSTVNLTSAVSAALTLDNLVSNGKVKLNASAAGGSLTINVKDALLPNTDVLNLELSNTGILAAGSITAAKVETININVADASTTGSAANTHTLTLVAADATKITVAGNNGLNLTGSNTAKITTFDASGVVANDIATTDKADKLAVTFTSGNTDATANVTIIGGAGDDVLTGNAAIDTITGGEGNDTITGGAGADILTGGAGADMFKFTLATDSNGVNADTITDFVSGTDKVGAVTSGATAYAITYAGEVSGYGTALTTLVAGKATAVLDTKDNTLYVDLDADGDLTVADLAIKLSVNDLSQTDFVTFTTNTGDITLTAKQDTIYVVDAAGTTAQTIKHTTKGTAKITVTDNGTIGSLDNGDIFAGAFDVINGFATGINSDKLDISVDNSGATAGNIFAATGLTANEYQIIQGTWDAATNKFTADSAGLDSLVAFDDGTNDVGIVLVGSTGTEAFAAGVLTIA